MLDTLFTPIPPLLSLKTRNTTDLNFFTNGLNENIILDQYIDHMSDYIPLMTNVTF